MAFIKPMLAKPLVDVKKLPEFINFLMVSV